jgi:hypothetical protein
MNARFLTTATLSIAFTAVALPAKAADPQLLNLVMPDVKVLAGVNVGQAKTSPFGQYVLSQMQTHDTDMQKLITLTGFDPTRDVVELLVATNGAPNTGLAMALGNFDAGKITAAATAHGATTETYGGATIIKDPKNTHGVSFLSASLVVAGDLDGVKAAIDRQKAPAPFSEALRGQVNQWSTTQDAWAISAVPPSSLKPPEGAPNVPGLTNGQGAFQTIQSAAGGVKFGNLVVVKAQAVSDNAQDATQLGDALKLLASLAAMQAGNDPAAAALAKSLEITTQGSTVNVQVSMPEDQLQQVLKPKANVRRGPQKAVRPI